MKTRIFLAGAIALAFAAGTVALPSLADAVKRSVGDLDLACLDHGKRFGESKIEPPSFPTAVLLPEFESIGAPIRL